MLERQLILRKLSEVDQLKVALELSQYSNLSNLLISQKNNQIKLHEAVSFDITNEVEDAKVMAKILERAIKYSIH